MMRKYLILFVYFSLCCNLFANPAKKYYDKAERTDSLKEKVKLYSISLRIDSEFYPALMKRAEVYYYLNDIKNADTDLKQYLLQNGADTDYFVLKGKVYQKKGMFSRAIGAYDSALKVDKRNDDALFHKGILLITLGGIKQRPKYYKEAVVCLQNVSSRSKSYKIALSQAAQCLEFESDYDQVLKIYQILTSQRSTNSSFYFNLGRILYFKEQYQESFAALNKACELTFKDSTFNEFYGVFRYIVAKKFLKEEISADYHFSLFVEKLPKKTIVSDLFKNKIAVDEFISTSLQKIEDKKYPKNLRARYIGNMYCQAAYFYLINDDIQKAMELFLKSEQLASFGAHYYYLAKYESQRLKIEQKNDINNS